MHAFLLKIISARMGNPVQDGLFPKSRGKSAEGFLAAIREARVGLGRSGPEKTLSPTLRAERSGAMKSKEAFSGRKDLETSNMADLRDLTPLSVLLRESGVSPEGTRRFIDSLKAQAPEARMPVVELVEAIRSLILSEKGAEGRLLLDPAARLRVESALTKWGFSPKEADRALSLAPSGNGEVDLERFVRTTLVERGEGAEKLFKEGEREGDPPRQDKPDGGPRASTAGAKAGTVSDQGLSRGPARGAPSVMSDGKAGEAVPLEGTAKASRAEGIKVPLWTSPSGNVLSLAGDGQKGPAKKDVPLNNNTFKAETAGKATPFDVHSGRSDGAVKEAPPERVKGWAGPEGPPRASKESASEQGSGAFQSRVSSSPPLSGNHQAWVKPAGAPASPLMAENIVPAHVISQVSRQLSRAALHGDQTIRLQLNPPQLGALKVQLEWNQDNLRIEMVTDRQPVKEILLSSLAELRQALGEQGFRVDKMEVQVEDSSGRPLPSFDQEHRNPSGERARTWEEASSAREEGGGDGKAKPFQAHEGRLLDVVA